MKKVIVEHLKYKYPMTDQLALNDLSFTIEKGECIGLVGQNGAGKSTLCQAIVGLVPHFYKGAYGGVVRVDELEVKTSEVSDMATKVGIVFQNPFTQMTGSKLTVFEEVAFGLENLGIPKAKMIERVTESLELLDILQYKDRNPFDLSGGQMQRVAIASILAMKPDVIILDEPTSQLDPQGTDEVFRVIKALSREGLTIIIAEHKVDKIAQYADRVLLLHNGELIAFDRPDKIFSRDDLSQFGVSAPSFTEICRRLDLKNDDGYYPVTLDEAHKVMVKQHE